MEKVNWYKGRDFNGFKFKWSKEGNDLDNEIWFESKNEGNGFNKKLIRSGNWNRNRNLQTGDD